MSFKKALAACAAAAALLTASAAPAAESQFKQLPAVNLTSVLDVAPYKPMSYALDYMAGVVSRRTGGKLTITRRMSYGDISPSDCLVKVVANTEDITVVPLEIVANFLPWVRIVCLPYLFSPRDYDALTVNGADKSEVCRRISENDTRIIALNTWYSDYLQLVMRNFPVERPEDLRGQNIWLPNAGPMAEYLSAMGANPMVMPMQSAVDAISRGMIDGMVTPLNGMVARNPAFEQMRFVSMVSFSRGGYAVLISQQKFDALPPAYQQVLREASQEAKAFLNDYNEECGHVMMGRLRRGGSIEVSTPDLTRFKERADHIRLIYLKRYPQAAERIRNILYGPDDQISQVPAE